MHSEQTTSSIYTQEVLKNKLIFKSNFYQKVGH